MRELKECTAEVFRRSEKRIRQRKRARNRMLACAIPLCFCIAVWSAARVPTTRLKNENIPSEQGILPEQSAPDPQVQDDSPVLVSIDVMDSSPMLVSTEGSLDDEQAQAADLNRFDAQTDDLTAENAIDAGNLLSVIEGYFDSDTTEPDSETEGASRSLTWNIVFRAKDGTETTYVLSDHQLTDTVTGKTVTLTDDQLVQLRFAMGLSN